ncbi:MAG: hypothetical protein LBR29_04455, partial [Methylobacteriaceae bacterium]|nr:hypothetical protein [Methylobacteriaceae bacterium]
MSDKGFYQFGFAIHHIIPQEALEQFDALLSRNGITKEMRGNKIALMTGAEGVETLKSGILGDAGSLFDIGWGLSRHNGYDDAHRQYDNFIIYTLRAINRDTTLAADPVKQKFILFDLFDYAEKICRGEVAGWGTDSGALYENWMGDYASFSARYEGLIASPTESKRVNDFIETKSSPEST